MMRFRVEVWFFGPGLKNGRHGDGDICESMYEIIVGLIVHVCIDVCFCCDLGRMHLSRGQLVGESDLFDIYSGPIQPNSSNKGNGVKLYRRGLGGLDFVFPCDSSIVEA